MSATSLAQEDLAGPRNEYLFAPPAFLQKALVGLLRDKRDAPALWLLLNIFTLALPAAACLFIWGQSHWVGLAYLLANYTLFLQRFMLTLHFTEHRPLFKKSIGALNLITTYAVCPIYGVPCGLYTLHHCVMHHIEDNHSPWDISSTEDFQRDNFLHFLKYWFRYWVCAWGELPLYAIKRKRHGWVLRSLASEVLYWVAVWLAWRANRVAATWIFIVPFFVTSLALMFGNWSQHIFVDPQDPKDTFKLTYNCLSCPDNSRTYNDGYHTVHHINSQTHWSELPKRFVETLNQYDEHDSLVFRGIGFFDVGLAVMTGRLGFLADRVVPCGPRQQARSKQDWVQLMRQRLKPVSRQGLDVPSQGGTTRSPKAVVAT